MASESGLVTNVGWDALGYKRVFDASKQAAVSRGNRSQEDEADGRPVRKIRYQGAL